MRLAELRPKFHTSDFEETDDYAAATGIYFECPGCVNTPFRHRIWAPFQDRYDGGGPAWCASGSGYQDLTFSDSPKGTRSIRVLSGCCSHFNVTSGAIDFYGDSGHTKPRETPMTKSTETQAADEATPSTEPTGPDLTGYTVTPYLRFDDMEGASILHQRWDNQHSGDGREPQVWLPVPGTQANRGEKGDTGARGRRGPSG